MLINSFTVGESESGLCSPPRYMLLGLKIIAFFLSRNAEELCRLVFWSINLTQTKNIWEEEISTEKVPPSDGPQATLADILLINN